MNVLGDTVFGALNPNSAEVRQVKYRQKEVRAFTKHRKNNRKNTASRRTQYITCQKPDVWPPEFHTKAIKHDSI